MARKMTEWPSKRGPITKIRPSDGCKVDTVPLAVGRSYNFYEFGGYLGNVRYIAFLVKMFYDKCVQLLGNRGRRSAITMLSD